MSTTKQNTLVLRASLKTVYPSDKWARKVDKMTDDQVIAVYHRLRNQGKL